VDFDIGVEAVGLPREQGVDLVPVGARREFFEAGDAFIGHRGVTFLLGHLDKFKRVVSFPLDFLGRADRFIEAAALGHHRLCGGLVVPQGRILDPGVELVETAQGDLPVERGPDQFEGSVDPVDKGLRVGTHDNLQS